MNDLLSEFPKFELSYETMSHNKVHDSDIILAIPEGEKFFAWFTVYNHENVCVLLDSNKKNIQLIVTSFNDSLATSLGTIFYGTIFKHNSVSCFCIEDVYYYKGYEYTTKSYLNKIQIIKDCLQKELHCSALTNKFTIFGLPMMNTNFNMLLREIDLLPYKISQIQFRYSKIKKILFIKYYKPKSGSRSNDLDYGQKGPNKAIFMVSPQIQNDIYNLFIYKNGKDEFYDIALIPDYTTSVLMNKLFRNIKENRNLDALEESDDETEFENERDDKFVFLDRSIKMNCQYNYKFKKWVPISLAGKNDRIISANLIQK